MGKTEGDIYTGEQVRRRQGLQVSWEQGGGGEEKEQKQFLFTGPASAIVQFNSSNCPVGQVVLSPFHSEDIETHRS